MLRPLLIATQFLTRLPLPKNILHEADYRPEQLGRSVLMYPVVGLLIGGLLVLMAQALHKFAPQLQAIVIASLLIFSWVLITGALHLDGLADSADAWVGGYGDRGKTLEIMKDPYCGPAGVSIIIIVLLVKFALLTTTTARSWPALLIAPVIARSVILVLFMTTAYVRKQGIGAPHAAHMPKTGAWLVISLVVGACVYLLQMKAVGLLAVVAIAFILLRYLMVKRLGGTTGDTAGAMIELMEVVVLLYFVLTPLVLAES